MSFLSQALSFFVKEAPHAAEDIQKLNALTKQIRDLVSGIKAGGRERDAALTALETVALQGFQALANAKSTAAKK